MVIHYFLDSIRISSGQPCVEARFQVALVRGARTEPDDSHRLRTREPAVVIRMGSCVRLVHELVQRQETPMDHIRNYPRVRCGRLGDRGALHPMD